MILHIFHDDKFINITIDQTEQISNHQNKYVVIVPSEDHSLVYVNKTNKIEVIVEYSELYYSLIDSLPKYQAVVIHYLCDFKARIINKAKSTVTFVWMIWGGDAYELINKGPIGKTNKRIEFNIYNLFVNNKVKRAIKFLLLNLQSYKQEKIDPDVKLAVNRFKFFTTILPEEKQIITKYLKLKAIHIPYSYGSIENFIPNEFLLSTTNGNNILIGNSGDPYNHHFKALRKIARIKHAEGKIIMPLSYGYDPYIKKCLLEGHKLLGNRFKPLSKFLPLDEYYKIIRSCSICIMHHDRQQALGNILMMGWIGAKIFLSEKNPTFHFLQKLGLIVFSTESDLIPNNKTIFTPFSDKDKFKNRDVILSYYSKEAVYERTLNFLNTITSNNELS